MELDYAALLTALFCRCLEYIDASPRSASVTATRRRLGLVAADRRGVSFLLVGGSRLLGVCLLAKLRAASRCLCVVRQVCASFLSDGRIGSSAFAVVQPRPSRWVRNMDRALKAFSLAGVTGVLRGYWTRCFPQLTRHLSSLEARG